jgi:fumarate reductase (CoM/CoB) subunit A
VNHVPEKELREKAPVTYETFLKNGVNLCTDSVEIAPLVQSFNGGVKIDENAATNVPGLFAVGEVSGGVHGADRPGGNNLADCQVFGYRGGRAAAELATDRPQKYKGTPGQGRAVGEEKPENLAPVREAIDKGLMVVRRRSNLLALLERIEAFREKFSRCSPTTENLLLTAEMVSRSALLREESRGIHYREDFPDTDRTFERPSLIRKGEGGDMEVIMDPAYQEKNKGSGLEY